MATIDKTLSLLARLESGVAVGPLPDSRCALICTFVYLIALLSVPVLDLSRIIIFAAFPILGAELSGIGYREIALKSLYILPFAAIVGIANPLLHTTPLITASSVAVSAGWVEFASIALRGLLAAQAALLLCYAYGFTTICSAMGRIGIPAILIRPMLMMFRYLSVILEEVRIMRLSARSRGYGCSSFPIRVWASFVGQLFIRSIGRSEQIHRAMIARGYGGEIVSPTHRGKWRRADTLTSLLLIAAITFVRFFAFQ